MAVSSMPFERRTAYCMNKTKGNKSKKVKFPLYSAHMRPQLPYCVQFLLFHPFLTPPNFPLYKSCQKTGEIYVEVHNAI